LADLKIERRAHREAARLRRLLREAGVEKPALDMARPVIDNTAWMKEKLEDARIAISESSVAISYDNGGGQTGIRENPLFRGYEALWRAYSTGMGQILGLVPESERAATSGKAGAAPTVLEMIRAKKEASGE